MKRLPLRARVSQLHQRMLLTLRWWFRLPIDDVREQHRQSLDQQVHDALQNMAAILNQVNARLHWYETRDPRLRKEYKAFQDHQKKLIKEAKAKQAFFENLIAEGVPEAVARERVWPRPKPKAGTAADEGADR